MNPNESTLGICFDYKKLGDGLGKTAWTIIWKALDPRHLKMTSLFEGELRQPFVYCLVFQNSDASVLAAAKRVLESDPEFIQFGGWFDEQVALRREPLPADGMIDNRGRIVGQSFNAGPTLEQIMLTKQDWSSGDAPEGRSGGVRRGLLARIFGRKGKTKPMRSVHVDLAKPKQATVERIFLTEPRPAKPPSLPTRDMPLPAFDMPLPTIGQRSGPEWDALLHDLERGCFHVLQHCQRANILVAAGGDNNLSLLVNSDALVGNPCARVVFDNRLLRIRLAAAYMVGGGSAMREAYDRINSGAERMLSIVQPTLANNTVLPVTQGACASIKNNWCADI